MADLPVGSGFRRRLTTAFVIVAVVAGGVLAVTSFVLVRGYRVRAFEDRAVELASVALHSAPETPDAGDFAGLLVTLRREGGVETVVTDGVVLFASAAELSLADVPDGMAEEILPGALLARSAEVRGESMLVIGASTPGGTTLLYFFFPREELGEGVRELRNVLGAGWLLVTVIAALFGHLVARRTLRPVNQAARASQQLAEGLLHTRLAPASDDEFGRWAVSFNTMAEALERTIVDLSEAARRERRFTANVAHELRTPLTGMVSACALLDGSAAALPPELARPARLLCDDVHRLRSLVEELLALARIDAGAEVADVEPLSLSRALEAVTRPWDGGRHIRVEAEPDVVVLADRARFRLVVGNLVRNAVERGYADVEVRGARRGDSVVVDVLDRGPGVADAELARLFERFFKADRSRATGGSGLGLAIALENARLQGGSLTARNRDGGGMCFTFVLPAGPDPAAVPRAGAHTVSNTSASEATSQRWDSGTS